MSPKVSTTTSVSSSVAMPTKEKIVFTSYPYITTSDINNEQDVIITEEDDLLELEDHRRYVMERKQVELEKEEQLLMQQLASTVDDEHSMIDNSKSNVLFNNEAKKQMAANETKFANEHQLQIKKYEWSAKFKPRKPQYFNRVRTGKLLLSSFLFIMCSIIISY